VEKMDEEDEEGAGMAVTMTKLNKRPKGQLRKKRADSDEEGGAKGKGARITFSGASAVAKKVQKVAEKKKSSLSFDTEEAGDVEEDAFASKKRAAGPEVLTFLLGRALRLCVLLVYTIAHRCNLFSCCVSSASPCFPFWFQDASHQ